MKRTKKKKNHIYFYDPRLEKKLNEIKKSEDLTWDELLKRYIKLPESDALIMFRFEEVRDLLVEKYKNKALFELMNIIWIFIINSANGEYDISRLKYDIEKYIKFKTYKKQR